MYLKKKSGKAKVWKSEDFSDTCKVISSFGLVFLASVLRDLMTQASGF
jgi:hypothetical protein